MIQRNPLNAAISHSEPLQQASFTAMKGIDSSKSITTPNVVNELENLDVNTDGSVSIRKPLIARKSFDVDIIDEALNSYSLKCKRIFALHLSNYFLILYDCVNATSNKSWIAIVHSEKVQNPVKIELQYEDYITYDVTTKQWSMFANAHSVSYKGVWYYSIPEQLVEHVYTPFINFNDANVFQTVDTTVFANCTVDLTNSNVLGTVYETVGGKRVSYGTDLYDSRIMPSEYAQRAPRYIHVLQNNNDTDTFTIRVKTPEVNVLDKGDSTPLNPNLTLDNPFATRDVYDSSYVDVLGIQMYAPTRLNIYGIPEYTSNLLRPALVKCRHQSVWGKLHSMPLPFYATADGYSYKFTIEHVKEETSDVTSMVFTAAPSEIQFEIKNAKCRVYYATAQAPNKSTIDANPDYLLKYVDVDLSSKTLRFDSIWSNDSENIRDGELAFVEESLEDVVKKYADSMVDYKDYSHTKYCTNDGFYKEACALMAERYMIRAAANKGLDHRYDVLDPEKHGDCGPGASYGPIYLDTGVDDGTGNTICTYGSFAICNPEITYSVRFVYDAYQGSTRKLMLDLGTHTLKAEVGDTCIFRANGLKYSDTKCLFVDLYAYVGSSSRRGTTGGTSSYSHNVSSNPINLADGTVCLNKDTVKDPECLKNLNMEVVQQYAINKDTDYTATVSITRQYGVTVRTSKAYYYVGADEPRLSFERFAVYNGAKVDVKYTGAKTADRVLDIRYEGESDAYNKIDTSLISKKAFETYSETIIPFDSKHEALRDLAERKANSLEEVVHPEGYWDGLYIDVRISVDDSDFKSLRVIDMTESCKPEKYCIVSKTGIHSETELGESESGVRILKAFMNFPVEEQADYYGLWEYSLDGIKWNNVYTSQAVAENLCAEVRFPRLELETSLGEIADVTTLYDIKYANSLLNVSSPKDLVVEEHASKNEGVSIIYKTNRPDCLVLSKSPALYGTEDILASKNPLFRFTVFTKDNLYAIKIDTKVLDKEGKELYTGSTFRTDNKAPDWFSSSIVGKEFVDVEETYTTDDGEDLAEDKSNLLTTTIKSTTVVYHGICVKHTIAQNTYTPLAGASWEFAHTDISNATRGSKLYYGKRVYSYGHEGFSNNVPVSDVGVFTTPLFNVADLSVSGQTFVTQVIPWRNYIIAFTEESVHLLIPEGDGFLIKTVSNSIGASSLDGDTCKALYNGVVFKSGSKVYTLYPNTASGDDSILNLNDISKPISNIIGALKNVKPCFSFSTERNYYIFIPFDTSTAVLKYAFDARVWTRYTYKDVSLDSYVMYGVDDIRLFGTYNGVFTEFYFEKTLDEVYPNLLSEFELEDFSVIPYGDVLTEDALKPGTGKLYPNITPIEFKLDSGQRTDNISLTKKFQESKFILATLNTKAAANISVDVYVDGNPYKVRLKGDGIAYKDATDQILTLGENVSSDDSDVYNTLSQVYLRYSGKGKTIRHVIKGSSLYNFKLYEVFYRYRPMPNKQ